MGVFSPQSSWFVFCIKYLTVSTFKHISIRKCAVLLALHASLYSARQKSVKAFGVSVKGYFRLPRTGYEKRMYGATNLKKACPSIWCNRPRLATAWAGTRLGLSWLGNCLSLSLGTGLRSPRGA